MEKIVKVIRKEVKAWWRIYLCNNIYEALPLFILPVHLLEEERVDGLGPSPSFSKYIILRTRFDYKSVCSWFATTHYVAPYKTIYMYYLKKSHDSLNRSCD